MRSDVALRRRQRIHHARCLRDALRYELTASGGRLRQLPAESELTERYGCSRNTLREALNLLRDEHLIERRQGAGTLVIRESTPHVTTGKTGLVHQIADGPARVSYEALELKEVGSSGAIASLLGLAPGAPLSVLPRLTIADGTPICLWDIFVPREVGGRLEAAPSSGDTYELFEHALGISIVDASMLVDATLADMSVSELLEVDVGAPLMRFERVISDTNTGHVVALAFGRARADRMALLWGSRGCVVETRLPVDAKRVTEKESS
jgi:GntR family transcriptional regulator